MTLTTGSPYTVGDAFTNGSGKRFVITDATFNVRTSGKSAVSFQSRGAWRYEINDGPLSWSAPTIDAKLERGELEPAPTDFENFTVRSEQAELHRFGVRSAETDALPCPHCDRFSVPADASDDAAMNQLQTHLMDVHKDDILRDL